MLAPRWRVVVALFTVTSCIATAVSTFGVFLPVLSETFGWSRGAVSVVLSISLGLGGIGLSVVQGAVMAGAARMAVRGLRNQESHRTGLL